MSLIFLEAKKRSLKPYYIAGIGISIGILFFMYLLVFIPYFDRNIVLEEPMIASYSFLFLICSTMNIIGFSCLCAAMLGKYVMNAYDDTNIYLTLSYPISRKKILYSKIMLCLLFCCTGVVLSITLNSLSFFCLESIFHFVSDQLFVTHLLDQASNVGIAILLVLSVGIISLEIGWRRSSLTVVIISSVLICSVISNIASTGNNMALKLVAIVLVFISLITFQLLKNRVLEMEV